MKSIKTSLLILLAGCFVLLCGCGGGQKPRRPFDQFNTPPATTRPQTTTSTADDDGQVVAAGLFQVHDHFITIEEILRKGRDRFEKLPSGVPEDAFRELVQPIVIEELRRAAGTALLLAEARTRLTEAQKAYVDAEVKMTEKDMITAAGGSKDQLNHDLAAKGVRLKELLDDYRRAVSIRLYLRRKFGPRVRVTREMIWKYYCAHNSDYVMGKKVQLQIIATPLEAFLAADVSNPSEAQLQQVKKAAAALIEQAEAAVKAGGDFAKVAADTAAKMQRRHGDKWETLNISGKIYITLMASSGGLWQAMSPQSLREEKLAAAAGSLKEGQVSEIIKTQWCYFIVKAKKVSPQKHVSFEEAQGQIEDKLYEQQLEELQGRYMSKVLLDFELLQGSSGVAVMDKFIKMTTNRVVARYWHK